MKKLLITLATIFSLCPLQALQYSAEPIVSKPTASPNSYVQIYNTEGDKSKISLSADDNICLIFTNKEGKITLVVSSDKTEPAEYIRVTDKATCDIVRDIAKSYTNSK